MEEETGKNEHIKWKWRNRMRKYIRKRASERAIVQGISVWFYFWSNKKKME